MEPKGQVIGVNTSIFTTGDGGGNVGIGFAIPTDAVQTFLASVRSGTATASAPADRTGREPAPIALGATVQGQLNDTSNVLPDGSFRPLRWSTPIARYRTYAAFHPPSAGEARWHESGGAYAYIELTFDEVRYNVGASMATRLKEPSDVDR